MNIYSHAILANEMLQIVQPAAPADFLWGSVAPDIRYIAGMRREHTHRPDAELAGWLDLYPESRSFLQGYRAHCMLDQIDTALALTRPAPLRWLRPVLLKKLRPRQAAVAVELYFHRACPRGLALTGGHNPVLKALGVREEQSTGFIEAIQGYLQAPSYASAVEAFTRLGMIDDARIERYAAEYQALQRSPLLLSLLINSVRNAKLEETARRMARHLAK